jgi:hypothetical protein
VNSKKKRISELSGNMFQFDALYFIGFLPDQVVIYGGDVSQMFSYVGPQTTQGLRQAFPCREAAVKAAQLHTRGVLDRSGFLEDIRNLGIDPEQLRDLENLIHTCNCAPVKFIERLVARGYAKVLPKVRIYEETPDFKESVDLFMSFLENTV